MRYASQTITEAEEKRQQVIKRIRDLYWANKMPLHQIRAHIEIEYTTDELRAIVLYKHDLHLI